MKLSSTNNTELQCNAEERTPVRTYAAENAVELHSMNNTELQYNAEERTPVGTYAAENAAELPSRTILSCNGILG